MGSRSEWDEYLASVPVDKLADAAREVAVGRQAIENMINDECMVEALNEAGPVLVVSRVTNLLADQIDEDPDLAYNIAATYAICAVMLMEERRARG